MNEYISREAMLKNLTSDLEHHSDEGDPRTCLVMRRFIKYVEDFPAADVQPVKRGRWEQIGEQSAKCTACGGVLKSNGIDKTGKALIFNAVYHYCPNCGARMIKDGDTDA